MDEEETLWMESGRLLFNGAVQASAAVLAFFLVPPNPINPTPRQVPPLTSWAEDETAHLDDKRRAL